MDNRIKVGLRVRPLLEKEKIPDPKQPNGSPLAPLWTENSGRVTVGADTRTRNTFMYDWCYDSKSQTDKLYQEMCLPLVTKVFEGYNATFFAYGQTGSGKTHTMGNTAECEEGIMPSAVQTIFAIRERCQQQQHQQKVMIDISYLEIYMEECFDLLSTQGEKKKVEVRENQGGETYVEGLTQLPVNSPQDVNNYIASACKVRTTSKTAMNAHSSRSHAICTFTIRITNNASSSSSSSSSSTSSSSTLVAKLNLVDLAGSERAKKTLATGDAFQEGVNINKGLLALGNVVSALCNRAKKQEEKLSASSNSNNNNNHSNNSNNNHNSHNSSSNSIHIPYRESKLTRLLKDSLGGNGMTVLLACVSPAASNFDETLNTLRFAARASSIVNLAKVNHEEQAYGGIGGQEMNPVVYKEMSRLRDQLHTMQEKYDTLLKQSSTVQTSAKAAPNTEMIATTDYANYLLTSLKLTFSLKSLLTNCFSNDIEEIDEELLEKIQEEIETIGSLVGLDLSQLPKLSASSLLSKSMMNDEEEINMIMALEGMEGLDCLPPIAVIIDQLKQLESFLQKKLKKMTGTSKASSPRANGVTAGGVAGGKERPRSDTIETTTSSLASSLVSNASLPLPILFAGTTEEEGEAEEISMVMMTNEDGTPSILELEESIEHSFAINASTGHGIGLAAASGRESEGSVQSSTSSSNDGDGDGEDVEEQFQLDAKLTEEKVTKLTNLGYKYESMIGQLNREISSLQNENTRLQQAEAAAISMPPPPPTSARSSKEGLLAPPPVAGDIMSIKSQIRQKSKQLEEKIKELQRKEKEYEKIVKSREGLTKELEEKQTQIQSFKRDKVKLMKEMREKESAHREEAKQLLKNDLQSKQRAMKAALEAKKLAQDLTSKERVWQGKLEAKDREKEMMKLLLTKKETVAKMKAAAGNGSSNSNGNSNSSNRVVNRGLLRHVSNNNMHNSESTNSNIELKKQLETILTIETVLAEIAAKKQHETEIRTRLKQSRIEKRHEMTHHRQGTKIHRELDEEVKVLESLIKERDSAITALEAKHTTKSLEFNEQSENVTTFKSIMKTLNQALDGSSSSSSSSSSGVPEATKAVILDCMQILYNQQKNHLKEKSTFKAQLFEVTQQQQQQQQQLQVAAGKGVLVVTSAAASKGGKLARRKGEEEDEDEEVSGEMDETFYPEDEEDDEDHEVGEEEDDNSDDDGYHRRKKAGTKKKTSHASSKSSGRSGSGNNSNRSSGTNATNATSKKRKSNELRNSSSGEEEGDNGDSQMLQDDILADEVAAAANNGKAKKPRTKKAATAGNDNGDNDAVATTGTTTATGKKRSGAAGKTALATAEEMAEVSRQHPIMVEKWNKCTIKELKDQLKTRALFVTGTKPELVNRLVYYEVKHSTNAIIIQQTTASANAAIAAPQQNNNKLASTLSISNNPFERIIEETSSDNLKMDISLADQDKDDQDESGEVEWDEDEAGKKKPSAATITTAKVVVPAVAVISSSTSNNSSKIRSLKLSLDELTANMENVMPTQMIMTNMMMDPSRSPYQVNNGKVGAVDKMESIAENEVAAATVGENTEEKLGALQLQKKKLYQDAAKGGHLGWFSE